MGIDKADDISKYKRFHMFLNRLQFAKLSSSVFFIDNNIFYSASLK